jgi:hypothetical protein
MRWLDVYLFFLYRVKLCIIDFHHKRKEATHRLLPLNYPLQGILSSFLDEKVPWSKGEVE